MLGAYSGGFGLLSYVLPGLFPVLIAQGREQVAFPMLAAVNQRDLVIQVPQIARANLAAADPALAGLALEHAETNAVWHLRVWRLADPFGQGSSHG